MLPPQVADEGTRHASPDTSLPDRIGPYRILALLGEGGMGLVYLAAQDEPVHREVAVKVLRAGESTDGIVARFESERQTLALMEHPNITRVYDAGTTEDGLPFFVMERVSGVPITEYAASHRLTTRERVKLIVQVCRATQHAHQKGIIHRDIKPSNVLVMESDGEPFSKIIDFGIARAIIPAAGTARLTGTGMVIGTPAYMSPEQFMSDGVDIDTRSDIYSIGVLLYELVAGVLPYTAEQSGRRSLMGARPSSEVMPPSRQYAALDPSPRKDLATERRTDPGTLRRTMSGDLDCIILKALETDRDRRYETSNALGRDLERYLADEPVTARAATAAYRAGKFARRHRSAVVFATALLVILFTVAVGATVQAQHLATAKRTAVARQAQAEQLIKFMIVDLRKRLEPSGKLDLLDEAGNRALAYFREVPESELSPEEVFSRAEAMRQLGSIRLAQGRLPEAAALMAQSLQLGKSLVARDSLNPQWQLGLAHGHFHAGSIEWARGNVDAALAHFQPFVRISDGLMARYPDSLSYRAEVAYALNNIGFYKVARGDARGALVSYQAALAILAPLVRRDSTNADWAIAVGSLLNASGVARRKTGDLAGAMADHTQELAVRQALARRDTTNRDWQRYVGIAHTYLSDIRLWTGDSRGALEELRAARRIYAAIVAHDSTNTGWSNSLANNYGRTAQVLLERDDPVGALRDLDGERTQLDRLVRFAPALAGGAAYQREVISTGTARGRALLSLGRVGEARAAVDQAVAAGESALARKAQDLEYRRLLADACIVRGEVLSRPGGPSVATVPLARALVLVDSLARTARETDFLNLQATSMLLLRGTNDAAPIVTELLHRGYRRPSFIRLVRANGIPVP